MSDNLIAALLADARSGDAIAVIDSYRTWTYAELFSAAVRISSLFFQPESDQKGPVVVLLEKTGLFVATVLAVLLAGRTFIPVSAEKTPPARVAQICDISRAAFLVTSEARKHLFSATTSASLVVVDPSIACGAAADGFLAPIQFANIAYVIFTSGTTGVPKGVAISHAAVLNTLRSVNTLFRLTCADRIFGVSAVSFDLSIFDIFGTLLAGGSVVFPSSDPDLMSNPAHWLDLVEKHRVTVWNSVPQLAGLICDVATARYASSIRLVMLSGDRVPLDLPSRLHAKLGAQKLEIYSLGGATECSIWSIYFGPLGKTIDPAWDGSVPYGRPLPGQSFYVLQPSEDHGQPPKACAVDQQGRLFIGGLGLADCYLNLPDRTASAFGNVPRRILAATAGVCGEGLQKPTLTDSTTERVYDTGDLGLLRKDGLVYIAGRDDQQLKILGNRIEAGEIEAHARSFFSASSIASLSPDCVAVPNADYSRIGLFVAPLAPERLTGALVRELESYLTSRLPPYMIPSAVNAIERLPLTANGKVDRGELSRMLSAKKGGAGTPNANFVLPSSKVEQLVVQALEELVGSAVSCDAQLSSLGLSSLHMIALLSRIQTSLGVRLAFHSLFTADTPSALASLIQQSLAIDAASSAVASKEPANSEDAIIVKLRASSVSDAKKKRLFLAPPMGGEVYCYQGVAVLLAEDVEVWGLRAPPEGTTKSRLIALYVDAIRQAQPHGPYFIGGYSIGTAIAACVISRLMTEYNENAALVAIDGMTGSGAEMQALFFSTGRVTLWEILKGALLWSTKRLMLGYRSARFGGPVLLWLFSLYLGAGYSKDLNFSVADFVPYLDEREMISVWLRRAKSAGLVRPDTTEESIQAQLHLTCRLMAAFSSTLPDGRLGCPALMLLGGGFLSADPTARGYGGPLFDRLKNLKRYLTRGPVTVHSVGPSNHLQVLYPPFHKEVAAGINAFMCSTVLAPQPTAEEKRIDYDEYPRSMLGPKTILAISVLVVGIIGAVVVRRAG